MWWLVSVRLGMLCATDRAINGAVKRPCQTTWLDKCRRLWEKCEIKLYTSPQMMVLAFAALLLKRFLIGSKNPCSASGKISKNPH